MTKQGTRVEVNTFVRGLITEASPLNYPANASIDEVNFELNRDGTRQRRLGLDLEEGYRQIFASALNNEYDRAVSTYVWEGAQGNFSKTWLVVQTGNEISFHDLKAPTPSQAYLMTLTLTFGHNTKYSFTAIDGKLVVAGGGTHVAVINFSSENTASVQYTPLRVRDVWGVEEDPTQEADPSFQNTELTAAHEYNLRNQGWGIPRRYKNAVLLEPTLVNPYEQFFNDLGKYPSNTESVWTGMQFQPSTDTTDPYERIVTDLYKDRLGLDLPAARGHFIINLHERGSSRIMGLIEGSNKFPGVFTSGGALPSDYMTSGASVVASYAGRVFYAGFDGSVLKGDKRSPTLSDHVFFSKLVKTEKELTECHQEGDPTSRENNDVLDTDGGYLRISGAQKIVAMMTVGKNLVVFATNGVWAVTGGGDYGFSATNYRVDKISSYGCVSPTSMVEVNGEVMYWGAESIYRIGTTQMGALSVVDFSAATINSYYDQIPRVSKENVSGVYDPIAKKIRWVYRVGEFFGEGAYAVELIFDTLLECFFQHHIHGMGQSVELAGVFLNSGVGTRYLSLHKEYTGQVKYSFAYYRDADFRDWKFMDGLGIDAKAYMMTGALTMSDSGIDKQAPYITIHFKRTETTVGEDGVPLNQSSCLMRCQWEWSNDPKSKKFSSLVETYRYRKPIFAEPGEAYDNGFDTVISKSKLRGRGKAITLYFETSPYKDCRILGWNLTINGNAVT